MRTSAFCRILLCCLLAFLMLIPVAIADPIDLSSLTNEEIIELYAQINQEIASRKIEKSATLLAGKYVAGTDLPAGSYTLICKTDDKHHGIVWVSSPSDNLDKDYPSILYKYIGFNAEEQFRITIAEGGMLNLPFPATLVISAGLSFN